MDGEAVDRDTRIDLSSPEVRKQRKVDQIIIDSAIWSSVGGIVPIPFFDIASVMAIQLKMINELSYQYDIAFRQDLGKEVIMALLGGIMTDYLGKKTFSSMVTTFAVGSDFKQIATSLWAGVLTYAVGKVFQRHFESGGTLLNFKSSEYRDFYKEKLKEAPAMLKC